MIGAFYDDFLSTVAKGRGMSKDAVRAVAKGRVWSGSQAMEVRRRRGVCGQSNTSHKPLHVLGAHRAALSQVLAWQQLSGTVCARRVWQLAE